MVQPSSAAGSLLPALPGLCLPPAERNAHVSVPVFLFPQFNEILTPNGDAALVKDAFGHGVCSTMGPSRAVDMDILSFSCSAPFRFKKPKEHFGNSYIKSRYLHLVVHVSKLTLWSEVIVPRRGLVEADRARSLSSSVSAWLCNLVPAPADKHSSFWQGEHLNHRLLLTKMHLFLLLLFVFFVLWFCHYMKWDF